MRKVSIGDLARGDECVLPSGRGATVDHTGPAAVTVVADGEPIGVVMTLAPCLKVGFSGSRSPHYPKETWRPGWRAKRQL